MKRQQKKYHPTHLLLHTSIFITLIIFTIWLSTMSTSHIKQEEIGIDEAEVDVMASKVESGQLNSQEDQRALKSMTDRIKSY